MLVICGRVDFPIAIRRKYGTESFSAWFHFSLCYFWTKVTFVNHNVDLDLEVVVHSCSHSILKLAWSAVTRLIWSTWMSWRQKISLINLSQWFKHSSGVRSGCLKPSLKCNTNPAKGAISHLIWNQDIERARWTSQRPLSSSYHHRRGMRREGALARAVHRWEKKPWQMCRHGGKRLQAIDGLAPQIISVWGAEMERGWDGGRGKWKVSGGRRKKGSINYTKA